jgi:hypothetical protein
LVVVDVVGWASERTAHEKILSKEMNLPHKKKGPEDPLFQTNLNLSTKNNYALLFSYSFKNVYVSIHHCVAFSGEILIYFFCQFLGCRQFLKLQLCFDPHSVIFLANGRSRQCPLTCHKS